jgi:hypothetical protein
MTEMVRFSSACLGKKFLPIMLAQKTGGSGM